MLVSERDVMVAPESCVMTTRMTSLPLQFVRTTLIVVAGEELLALAEQSRPFTKLAVTVPPPLTVAVTGFAEPEGVKLIDAELEVQIVNVNPVFGVSVMDTVDP
jgi:hypothetical protein